MNPTEQLRPSDPATVARYLQIRSHFHDHVLARLEALVLERYAVRPTHRLQGTLPALLRVGFERPGEGELWPVVFLTPVDLTLALCLQITSERLAGLGTVINGPQPVRHRHWEDFWGWETSPAELHAQFYDLPPDGQERALLGWFGDRLEWMAHNGLLRRK
jgi:hypothetical protein